MVEGAASHPPPPLAFATLPPTAARSARGGKQKGQEEPGAILKSFRALHSSPAGCYASSAKHSSSLRMPKPPKESASNQLSVPVELIERRIYLIRGHKVMLDSDLAELYQVGTKVLNQAVRRNLARFPEDFMLQLTPDEAASLRSQTVTSNVGRGGRRYPDFRN